MKNKKGKFEAQAKIIDELSDSESDSGDEAPKKDKDTAEEDAAEEKTTGDGEKILSIEDQKLDRILNDTAEEKEKTEDLAAKGTERRRMDRRWKCLLKMTPKLLKYILAEFDEDGDMLGPFQLSLMIKADATREQETTLLCQLITFFTGSHCQKMRGPDKHRVN